MDLPKQCFDKSPVRSWWTLLRLLILLSLTVYLETLTNSWPLIFIWFFHGQVLVGFFVLGHDCGHHSFSKNRTLNQIVGLISLAPLGNGYFTWQRTHNTHHAKTQLKGVDIDWSSWLVTRETKLTWKRPLQKIGYVLPFGVFWFVFVNAIRRGFQKNSLKESCSNLLMWSSIFGLYTFLVMNYGWWGLFKYHAIPATIAMFTGYFLLTIQHANETSTWYNDQNWEFYKAQFGSTFDVRFPRVLEWLWLDINIHVPHHLFPQMPWYRLKESSLILKEKYPELYKERRMSLKELSWMIRTPYIKEVENGCAVLDQRLE